ncbi:MAG: hypothetical protein LBO79_00195 [Zoogloeaceae bacterium]|jgi:hypothetical protein|nr:hypothetical protein [Zoogloeaceae bacterium]
MAIRSFLFLFLWLSLAAPAVFAAKEPSHPPPLPGETRTNMELQIKGQFAPPLAVGDGSALLFQANSDREIRLWRIFPAQPERSSHTRLPIRIETWQRKNLARYASIATRSGVWLVGPSIHLIRSDGKIVSGKLTAPRDAVQVVALPDDSVMALGGYAENFQDFSSNLKVDRVWLDDKGAIHSEELPPLPVKLGTAFTSWGSFDDFSALHIGNGQVLVTGSEYHKATLLYEPAARIWHELPAMLIPRDRPALIRLPDGRVWATGGSHQARNPALARLPDGSFWVTGENHPPTTSEFWDPEQRVWQRGPDLPAPMLEHQAVWVAEEGAVLLGAGFFPVVLAWKPGEKAVRVAAQMSIERRGGALMPLPGRSVGVVSGAHARGYDEGWGRRSPGSSVMMTWTTNPAFSLSGTWQITEDGGLSLRGDRLLAVGGTLTHAHWGQVKQEVTRLAELREDASGQMKNPPALPFDAPWAEVAWMDGRRALIHAEGQLALLDLETQDYRLLDATPLAHVEDENNRHSNKIDDSRLVGADGQRAWLISGDASVHWVDADSGRVTEGPRLPRKRLDFIGRVLTDGRVIVAGGGAKSETIARRPGNCADCPVEYIGWGSYGYANRHEIYDPVRKIWYLSSPSQTSCPYRDPGMRPRARPENNRRNEMDCVAILASGQVVKAGLDKLEISSPDGSTWRTLPLPGGAFPEQFHANIRLFAPLGDSGPYPDAVFFGIREAVDIQRPLRWRWWWLPSANAPDPVWREIGTAFPPYVFPGGEIPLEAENGPARAIGSAAGVMVRAGNKDRNGN